MKLSILSVVCLALVLEVNCGFVDNYYFKVENSTKDIKNYTGGWWNYGRDLVFGNKIETNQETINTTTKKPEGYLDRFYNGAKGTLTNVGQTVHNVIFGTNPDPNKGFIGNTYDRVKKRIDKTKQYIFGNKDIADINARRAQEVDYDDTKPIRDAINKYIVSHSTKDDANSLIKYLIEFRNNMQKHIKNKLNVDNKKVDSLDAQIVQAGRHKFEIVPSTYNKERNSTLSNSETNMNNLKEITEGNLNKGHNEVRTWPDNNKADKNNLEHISSMYKKKAEEVNSALSNTKSNINVLKENVEDKLNRSDNEVKARIENTNKANKHKFEDISSMYKKNAEEVNSAISNTKSNINVLKENVEDELNKGHNEVKTWIDNTNKANKHKFEDILSIYKQNAEDINSALANSKPTVNGLKENVENKLNEYRKELNTRANNTNKAIRHKFGVMASVFCTEKVPKVKPSLSNSKRNLENFIEKVDDIFNKELNEVKSRVDDINIKGSRTLGDMFAAFKKNAEEVHSALSNSKTNVNGLKENVEERLNEGLEEVETYVDHAKKAVRRDADEVNDAILNSKYNIEYDKQIIVDKLGGGDKDIKRRVDDIQIEIMFK